MLTTQIPSKATPEYLDQVIGNADTGQSSKKTRVYTLDSILNSMVVPSLLTNTQTIVGAINEICDDYVLQSEINNIFI